MNEPELKAFTDDLINKYINFIDETKIKNIIFRLVEDYYNKGLLKGELSFNMNFVPNYHTLSFIQNYSYENVKKLTVDLKDKLRSEVSLGLMNHESVNKISVRIRDVLNSTVDRARLITITETNRAFNMGHYQSFKDSGLNLKKQWSAQPERDENNPCPICEEMDGKTIDMDKLFKFSNGQSVLLPPLHPRCKCRILGIQVDD